MPMLTRIGRLPSGMPTLLGALVGLVIAAAVKGFLLSAFELPTTYQPFHLGVAAAAVVGGFWAGIITMVLGAAYQATELEPIGTLGVEGTSAQLRMALFLIVALIISGLSGLLRSGRTRAAETLAAERETRVRLQEAEQEAARRLAVLEAVAAAADDAVVVADPLGRITTINPVARSLFAGDLPASLGDLLGRLRDAEGQAVGNGDLEGVHVLRLDSDGPWVEVRSARHDESSTSIIVLRDVTAFLRSAAVNDAFLGVLSHELRTPVTTIYGYALLLVRKDPDPVRRELATDIVAEAERLTRLMDDLLVLSRVERDRLEVGDEPILLQHVIRALIDIERRRFPVVTFELQIPDDLPPVVGDRTYIEQAVRNLVGNAIKYGPPGGSVSIQLDCNGNEVLVRVLDDGPGFPSEDAQQLFDLFYRAPVAKSVAPGAGIGLFVTKHLVTTMGGRIWAAPRAGGGAEFGFALNAVEDGPDHPLP